MNKSFFSTQKKLGILGGGQLGKMLLQTTRTWDIYTKVLDPDNEAPARLACNEFHVGSLMDYDTVFNFGKDCDVVTIEIEHVNVHALQALKKQGVTVHPDPNALEIINDKGLQKMFFKANDLPTSDFMFFENKDDVIKSLNQGDISLPFVQKSRKDGYDGRGVQIVNIDADTERLLNGSCLVEDKVDLKMEIAIIASRNIQGQVACYDAVAMDFVEGANMLDLLLYPVAIDATLVSKAKDIASALIQKLNICGLLAVEFFIDKKDTIYINEIAPRPHNSGHQTIESSETSQYEQHLRGILDLPLGSTNVTIPSVMVNLLGAEGYSGNVYYEHIEKCMATEGVHVHIYGKKQTRPFRKMGHVTVTNKSLDEAKKIAQWVKQTLIVKSL
jgi:5-(carboxyamino)imidazole ribonucleotide synthase